MQSRSQTGKMDDLSADVLQLILAECTEISWQDQETAEIPRVAPPSSFLLQQARLKASRAASGATRRDGNDGSSYGHVSRATRKAALRRNENPQMWDGDIFPFGYEEHFKPELLTPLKTLLPEDPVPLSSVIVSPYMRIPQYTYCARTSLNWRRPTRNLHKRCHWSSLPFWDEDSQDKAAEFRDRINVDARAGNFKLAFTLPDEQEDHPPLYDDIEQTDPIPSDAICAVCLAVGCIVHHNAPAVKLPTVDEEETSKAAPPAASTSALSATTNAGLSRWRRKHRDRGNNGCGSDCVRAARSRGVAIADMHYTPYSQWSAAEKADVVTVLSSIGDAIAASASLWCTLASYISGRTCTDIGMAIDDDRILDPYITFGSSSRGSGHLPSPELPDEESQQSQSDKHRHKRKRKDHEGARQRDIERGFKYVPPEDPNGDFTADDLRKRIARTALPWLPCYHPGRPCTSFTGKESTEGEHCACRRNGAWCEPGCGCPVDCPERFAGCTCAKDGRECRIGADDTKGNYIPGCNCQEHARECHVELCAGHDEKKCRLMSLQDADSRAIRTFISTSELEGYGLFVGEDTNQTRVYVGEYKGELINEHEAGVRSALYFVRSRSFLFDLTRLGVVDGNRLGNKTRYMNTARNGRNNASGSMMQVNGEARLLVHATKEGKARLQKNDELLLDYGAYYDTF